MLAPIQNNFVFLKNFLKYRKIFFLSNFFYLIKKDKAKPKLLYIYTRDLQENDKGANTWGRQLPRTASRDAKILLSA